LLTLATRSSVANASWVVAFTNARCGRSTGTCDEIFVAVSRASCASAPGLGLANAYCATLGIDGTPTVRACSTWGVSLVVDQPISGSTGDGIVSRYRPSQPGPCDNCGFAVDQMSVPWKCDRLEFA